MIGKGYDDLGRNRFLFDPMNLLFFYSFEQRSFNLQNAGPHTAVCSSQNQQYYLSPKSKKGKKTPHFGTFNAMVLWCFEKTLQGYSA